MSIINQINGALLGSCAALFVLTSHANASAFAVLHEFNGEIGDGTNPYSSLLRDSSGNLFGTTDGGGGGTECGCGTVFELAPDGTETILHAFGNSGDKPLLPLAALIADKAGNFYGTTQAAANGQGAVFKLAPNGTETALHVFTGGADGATPLAPLVDDKDGNLYGTTSSGGGNGCHSKGCGTVFKVAPDGTETVLHAFSGKNGDGSLPAAGLLRKGNDLYGTTVEGGTHMYGTVFRLSLGGSETVLHSFSGGSGDGVNPEAGLIMDSAGNLYGTTISGGAYQLGAVFKLAPGGTIGLLHSFAGGSDGASPEAGLLFDKHGNLYGTTNNGGSNGCQGFGCGTVFKLAPDGTETVLHSFKKNDGLNPEAPLIDDGKGNLYGTTPYGGYHNYGTIFTVKQ